MSNEVRVRMDANYLNAFDWYKRHLDPALSRAHALRALAAPRLFAFRQARYFSKDSDATFILDRNGRLHYFRSDELVINNSYEDGGSRYCRLSSVLDMKHDKFRHILDNTPAGRRTQLLEELWLAHGQLIQTTTKGVLDYDRDPDGLNAKYMKSVVEAQRGDVRIMTRHAIMSPAYLIRRKLSAPTKPSPGYRPLDLRSHMRSSFEYPIPTLQSRITFIIDRRIYPSLDELAPEVLEGLDPLERDRLASSPRSPTQDTQIRLAIRLGGRIKLKNNLREINALTGGMFSEGTHLNLDQARQSLEQVLGHYRWWRDAYAARKPFLSAWSESSLAREDRHLEQAIRALEELHKLSNKNLPQEAVIYTLSMPFIPVQSASFEFRCPRPYESPLRETPLQVCEALEQRCLDLSRELIGRRPFLDDNTELQDTWLTSLLALRDALTRARCHAPESLSPALLERLTREHLCVDLDHLREVKELEAFLPMVRAVSA